MVAALLAIALSACSGTGHDVRQYDGRIGEDLPAALLDSDLGITEADASRSQSGVAFHLTVVVSIERDVVTADELRRILTIIVDTVTDDPEAFSMLSLDVADARSTSPIGAAESIDLSAAAAELGLQPVSSTNDRDKYFPSYSWADVVALVQE
ncbi:hypothetical protein [Microbacterium sp. Marseille-Q6965]|uniref:hypothetical protein n=1 Tax=Microbacterium sp. Marseille-Q6965 TaxID=2965072 RepID=UPI0021B79B06|nr:hypothetical protein [Microbacterium sp. Marseille-Q6965]